MAIRFIRWENSGGSITAAFRITRVLLFFFYYFLLEHVLLFVAKLQKRYKETLGEVWKVRAEGVTLKLVLEISGIFLFKRDFFAYFAKINGCNV